MKNNPVSNWNIRLNLDGGKIITQIGKMIRTQRLTPLFWHSGLSKH